MKIYRWHQQSVLDHHSKIERVEGKPVKLSKECKCGQLLLLNNLFLVAKLELYEH